MDIINVLPNAVHLNKEDFNHAWPEAIAFDDEVYVYATSIDNSKALYFRNGWAWGKEMLISDEPTRVYVN